MIQNRDVVKELQVGMLVAVVGPTFSRVGTVQSIPSKPCYGSKLAILWLEQEKAPHKPLWMRYFRKSRKDAAGTITFSDIVLYDFELTKNEVQGIPTETLSLNIMLLTL